MLVGESVDVDVDEPSVTIRWAVLACGNDFMLSGSAGVHGTNACGLPSTAMHIYVDRYDHNAVKRYVFYHPHSDESPTFTYDPSEIPFNKDTGHRRRYTSRSSYICPLLKRLVLVSKTLYNLIVTTLWTSIRIVCIPSILIFSPALSERSLSTIRPSPFKRR